MSSLKLSFLSLLAVAMLLVSCDSDNTDTGGTVIIDPPTETVTVNPLLERSNTSTGGLELGCVTVLYTFEIADQANNVYSVASEQDFLDLVSDSSFLLADFVYPLDIEVDGTAQTADDGDDLASAFAQCVPDTGFSNDGFPAYNISAENSCYSLVFPVALQELDGSTTTISDEAAFDIAVADRPLFFEFPLQLEDEDGNIVSAADPDDMFNLLIGCNEWDIDSTVTFGEASLIACYTMEFPFDVVLADGTTTTVNDNQELTNLILGGQVVDFGFPMTLSLNDSIFTVADVQALEMAIADCPGFGGPTTGSPDALLLYAGTEPVFGSNMTACWTVDFPINVLGFDGVVTAVVDQPGFEAAINDGTAFSLEYPVSYTFLADGTSSTANDTEGLIADLESCQ